MITKLPPKAAMAIVVQKHKHDGQEVGEFEKNEMPQVGGSCIQCMLFMTSMSSVEKCIHLDKGGLRVEPPEVSALELSWMTGQSEYCFAIPSRRGDVGGSDQDCCVSMKQVILEHNLVQVHLACNKANCVYDGLLAEWKDAFDKDWSGNEE